MLQPNIMVLSVILTILLTGCGGIPEAEYRAVVSERDALKSQLKNILEKVDYLEKEYNALKEENNSLRNELETQNQEVSRLMTVIQENQIKEESASEKIDNIYIVKSGDTLWRISQRFEVPVEILKELNHIQDSNIKTGQRLILP